ncbi:MAG: DUF4097 family beta strand repeat protein [Nonomuraea sp.]|nr:DUF4097 family beta strand repeat protein [Nonomuraea sp.]
MRAAWLTAGTICTIIATMVATVALWRGFAMARPPVERTYRTVQFSGKSLKVEASRGRVTVRIVPGEAGVVVVDREVRWSKDRPAITQEWDGRKLTLGSTCPDTGLHNEPLCSTDFLVSVPPETAVEARSTSGQLDVTGVTRELRLTTVSGDVRVSDSAGPLTVRSGSGDIDADFLSGDKVDVETGGGDVRMLFDVAPHEIRAVARTRGAVNILVPEGRYDVTAQAERTRVLVESDSAAPRKITASAPKSSVSIGYR